MSLKSICVAWMMAFCLLPLMASAAAEKEQLHHPAAGSSFAGNLARLVAIRGFSCQFNQQMTFSDGGDRQYSGELAILKPGHFRWQYLKPYQQLYVGDGQSIYHYEPDLMQVEYLSDLEAVNPIVMKLLNGQVPAAEIKVLQRSHDLTHKMYRFNVQVKDAPQVWLGFSAAGYLLTIERQDLLGNDNLMTLSQCRYVAPDESLFNFTPPAGVDLLDLRSDKR
ncbi:MAG: outer-membrane lipoprotein carrier protein LolA [Mariprofundus sp.]|nr:outer-membrane lipoprotein carrier protein LolA [Mariprofundus sp.]